MNWEKMRMALDLEGQGKNQTRINLTIMGFHIRKEILSVLSLLYFFFRFSLLFFIYSPKGCYLDADAGIVSFSVNEEKFNTAFMIPKQLKGHTFYPAIVLKNAEVFPKL